MKVFSPIAILFSCKGYIKLCPDDTGQEVNSGSERIFSPDVQQLIRIYPLPYHTCMLHGLTLPKNARAIVAPRS